MPLPGNASPPPTLIGPSVAHQLPVMPGKHATTHKEPQTVWTAAYTHIAVTKDASTHSGSRDTRCSQSCVQYCRDAEAISMAATEFYEFYPKFDYRGRFPMPAAAAAAIYLPTACRPPGLPKTYCFWSFQFAAGLHCWLYYKHNEQCLVTSNMIISMVKT